jgi:hypothetical protein
VLKDISMNADKYDDEFIGKFGAKRVMEPKITPYSDETMSAIQTNVQKIASEALDYSAYFESQRWFGLAIDALYIGIARIGYYGEPTGLISTQLVDAINALYNTNNDINTRIKNGRDNLGLMKIITMDQCKDTFYMTYQVIPRRGNASRNFLKDWIATAYTSAKSMFDKEDWMSMTHYSLYLIYWLLADYNIDENCQKAIEYTLSKSADKPWKDAAPYFMKVLTFLSENKAEKMEMEEDKMKEEPVAKETDHFEKAMGDAMKSYHSMMGDIMKKFAN